MRLLHIVESLDRGGLERVVCDLAAEQFRRGHQVEVLCLFTRGEFAEELAATGVRVHQAGKRQGLDWATLATLRRTVRAGGHELIHTHNPVANYYAALAELTSWRSLPIVNTRHNMGARNPKDRREKLFRLSVARTAKVAMVSQQVSQKFIDTGVVPASKAAVVMNGIPLQRYHVADAAQRAAARAALGLPADALVIGTVGRLVGVKNHALLLQAVAPLKARHPGLVVAMIGDGPLRGELAALAQSLSLGDAVCFIGERPDVPQVIGAYDVFAMPSLSEGHSIALLEAASSGLAIVATAVGGNPEIVQDGRNGLLVPSQDAPALTAALDRLLGDATLRARLGGAARQWAVDEVSLDAMTDRYEALYRAATRR
ncbi:glycosyltransferase [Leptothrix sp. BB-4]